MLDNDAEHLKMCRVRTAKPDLVRMGCCECCLTKLAQGISRHDAIQEVSKVCCRHSEIPRIPPARFWRAFGIRSLRPSAEQTKPAWYVLRRSIGHRFLKTMRHLGLFASNVENKLRQALFSVCILIRRTHLPGFFFFFFFADLVLVFPVNAHASGACAC